MWRLVGSGGAWGSGRGGCIFGRILLDRMECSDGWRWWLAVQALFLRVGFA